jgi:KDO2-lipid IV(A) lauroyltransferase
MRLRFLLPAYWPLWGALVLLRRLARRDYPKLLRFGAKVGGFAYRLPLPQKSVVDRNLRWCFPDWTSEQRARVAKEHFRDSGITLCETALAWFADRDRLLSLAEFEGLDELDRHRAEGRGVILLAAHFTTLEIGARLATGVREVHAVYKPSKNLLLTEFFRRYRGAVSAGMIASDDIRSMVRVLKRGGVVWYAPDQAFRGKGAEEVLFFDHPVATNTATSRLAELTGAVVMPYFVERLPGSTGYRVRIGPALAGVPSGNSVADARLHHELIEAEIRRIPSQYLWLHKRFKRLSVDPYV